MQNFGIAKVLAISSLALILFIIPLLPAEAIEYGGFGGRPAYPKPDNPRTESIFIYTLEPGATQEEGVLVVNNTAERKTLLVYAADSTPSSGGGFACKQFSESKVDVGAWITLVKSEVTLEPGKNEVVPFTIRVPQNISVGEHNGCILIQEKKIKPEGQTGMSLSVRTGLRVVITIPGEIMRKLEIVGFTITPKKNNYLLQPRVKNIGNVSIDAAAAVITRYFFGLTFSRHGGQYPILCGETTDWNFELKRPFWGGWFRSVFFVEYDENPEAGVGVKSGKALTRLKGPSAWFFSFPTPAGLAIELIVFLFLVACLFLLWFSQKRKKWIKEKWEEYKVRPGEDIKTLAERFDVSWKLLVKANTLKPPFSLKTGEKIKIPSKEK